MAGKFAQLRADARRMSSCKGDGVPPCVTAARVIRRQHGGPALRRHDPFGRYEVRCGRCGTSWYAPTLEVAYGLLSLLPMDSKVLTLFPSPVAGRDR